MHARTHARTQDISSTLPDAPALDPFYLSPSITHSINQSINQSQTPSLTHSLTHSLSHKHTLRLSLLSSFSPSSDPFAPPPSLRSLFPSPTLQPPLPSILPPFLPHLPARAGLRGLTFVGQRAEDLQSARTTGPGASRRRDKTVKPVSRWVPYDELSPERAAYARLLCAWWCSYRRS